MNFQIDIISLEGQVYSGEVEKLTIPTVEGVITVLARHMPIVVPLVVGEVIVYTPSGTLDLSIGKGIFAFSGGRGKLLIEDVTSADEVSEQEVLMAKKKAEELLARGVYGEEKLQAMYILRKSLVDLKLLRKKRKTI